MMKQRTKNWLGIAALVLSSSAVTGVVMAKAVSSAPDVSNTAETAQAAEQCREMPFALAEPSNIPAPTGLVDLTAAAESSVNSVVYIRVTVAGKTQRVMVNDPFDDFFNDFFGYGGRGQRQPQEREYRQPDQHAQGSGVIISTDGYIVTNNHVVGKANEISVKLNDGREFKGRIVGTDETTDLALIKIDAKNLPAIPIGNSDKLKLGEWVLAVGNPFNLTSTVTAGIVSAKARTLGANGVESFIQTDAAINSGNSGGALVNARGELVGINAMLYSQTGSYSGYGFAIPTTIMNKVVNDLKVYGVVQRAVLGVMGTDVSNYIDMEEANGNTPDLGTVTGVYVSELADGSVAEEIGLKKGDVIVGFANKKIDKMSELQEQLAQHKPGDKVALKYIRDKKETTVTVELRNSRGTTKVLEEGDIDQMGVKLRTLSDQEKQEFHLSSGLMVTSVSNGKMKNSGVAKGTIILQVNGKAMQTVDDWEKAIVKAESSNDRTLWIRGLAPSGRKVSFVIELGE